MKRISLLFLLVLTTTSISLFAQSGRALLNEADTLYTSEPTRSLQILETALSQALRNNDANLEADCYVVIAKVNNHLGQYDLAARNLRRAKTILDRGARPTSSAPSRSRQLEEVESISDEANYNNGVVSRQESKYSLYTIQKLLAQSLRKQGLYNEAITEMQVYASMATARRDTLELTSTWNAIGDLHLNLGDESQAQRYYQRTIDYAGISFASERAKASLGLGLVEQRRGNYDGAVYNYNQAEQDLDEIELDTLAIALNQQVAQSYRAVGRTDKSIELGERNLERMAESGYNVMDDVLTDEEVLLANDYIETGNNSEALPILIRARDRAQANGNLDNEAKAWKGLSHYYESEGDVSEALNAYRKYVSITDSIEKRERLQLSNQMSNANTVNQQLIRLESVESEMRLNDQQIEILRQDRELQESSIRQKNLIIVFLIIAFGLMTGAIFWISWEARKRNRANQMLALKSLRSQMNPHFIFNALNSINGFISRKQEREANKYLAEFSKLMRSVLEDSQEDFLSLRDELENIQRYVKLEHSRFEDKFDYAVHIDESIDLDQWQIPPMLIQPYVENAVWHGLRYKEAKGTLKITVREQEAYIEIAIEDDGVGRERSQELKTRNQQKSKSTGIKNTAERLKLLNDLYKTHYSIDVDDLQSDSEDVGTRVVVKVPKKAQL